MVMPSPKEKCVMEQMQARRHPNLLAGQDCLPSGMGCTRGWAVTPRPLLAAAVTPRDVQREHIRCTNVLAQPAMMARTGILRAWGATPALLTAPPLLPRPPAGTCWLLLHSSEGADKWEGLGASCSEHLWWEGDIKPVPQAQAGSASLLPPAQGLRRLSRAGGR